MTPSRRDVLATTGASIAAVAGCAADPPGSSVPSDDVETGDGETGDRPTATARDPDALDVSGEWPQRGGGPGHAGVTDASGVPESGSVHWHLRRVRSGPVALHDELLVHYAKLGEVRAGRPTLTRTREPDAGTAHPIYGVPHLVARDASEGYIQWTARLPELGVGWPAIGGDRVVATVRGRLSAHDVASGAERWSVGFDDHPVGVPTVADGIVVAPLSGVVDGESGEYVHEPRVGAFALSDGSERWTVGAPARGLGVGVAGDTAVVVAHDFDGSGSVQARSLADGSERWRTDLSGQFAFSGPVLADDLVFVAASGGRLHALSLSDGSERWTVRKAGDGLAVGDDAVYTVDRSQLFARDPADGGVRWSFEVEGQSLVTPAVGGDTVYVGGNFVDLYALDAADGTERWSHAFPTQTVEGDMVMSGLANQPTVADGAVYAYAADGLYAFGPG